MKQTRHTTNLLTAGTVVALLLLIYLAFDRTTWNDVFAASTEATTLTSDNPDTNAQVVVDQQTWTTLQGQNAALQQTVETLEARDIEYQAAIANANATIQTLETNVAAATTAQTEPQQLVQTLQAREAEYRTQLETANATIHRLESALQNEQTTAQTFQGQNIELARVVKLMQEREAEYQQQLQAANAALQAQAAGGSTASVESYRSYEEHEEHEHEHEESEHDDD